MNVFTLQSLYSTTVGFAIVERYTADHIAVFRDAHFGIEVWDVQGFDRSKYGISH